MKFTYAYKTSDGVRHEEGIEAESREAVFVTLRERGIRPIKVVAADGSKANGEGAPRRGLKRTILAAMAVGLVLGGATAVLALRHGRMTDGESVRVIDFTTPESRVAYTNLEASAAQLLRIHQERLAALDLGKLSDYEAIASARDMAGYADRIRAGYGVMDKTRIAVRDLFRSIFDVFPATCVTERREAQRLYAEAMDVVDETESRLAKDEKAFRLLNAHRDAWRYDNGRIIWSDAALGNEFEYFHRMK